MTPLHTALGVYRWHTNRTLGRLHQTTADHSARMCGLAIDLWGEDVPASLFRAIILHDAAEFVVGDMPGPAKAKWEWLHDAVFSAELIVSMENDWGTNGGAFPIERLAFLDRLEAYLFCRDNDPAQAANAEWTAAREWIDTTAAAMGIGDRLAEVMG